MPLNSVNTNIGAMVALQSLNKTNDDMAVTQKRISTGMRVQVRWAVETTGVPHAEISKTRRGRRPS